MASQGHNFVLKFDVIRVFSKGLKLASGVHFIKITFTTFNVDKITHTKFINDVAQICLSLLRETSCQQFIARERDNTMSEEDVKKPDDIVTTIIVLNNDNKAVDTIINTTLQRPLCRHIIFCKGEVHYGILTNCQKGL